MPQPVSWRDETPSVGRQPVLCGIEADVKSGLELARHHTRLEAAKRGVDTVGLEMTVLREAVRRITGLAEPSMRQGQVDLMGQITDAMRGYSEGHHVSAEASTGTGKSLAGVVPAAVAALRGERTVISTESLALQAQVMDKDAPLVMDCVQALTGVRPTFAVHKGWSNYVCAKSAVDAADQLIGSTKNRTWVSPQAELDDAKQAIASHLAAGTTSILPAPKPKRGRSKTPVVVSTDRSAQQAHLVEWALQQTSGELTGDRNTYTGTISGREWEQVSVASTDCVGDSCPLAGLCLPRKARRKVMVADLVVTNHALLGVQAAKAAKTVFGSKSLGRFDHLIVDECHALPQVVRNQGAAEVSERSLRSVLGAYTRTFTDGRGVPAPGSIEWDGEEAIADVVAELASRIGTTKGAVAVAADRDPLEHSGDHISSWLVAVATRVGQQLELLSYGSPGEIKLRRLASRVSSAAEAVSTIRNPTPGVARWMEQATNRDGHSYPVAQSSPVDVSPLLRGQLWVVEQPDAFDDTDYETETEPSGDGPAQRTWEPITVVAMSATVPRGFTVQAGLDTRTVAYPSPFEDAYAGSALFVPKLVSADADQLCVEGYNGKWRFDVRKHAVWSAGQIEALVTANGGSALVLSATADAGRAYAERLRAALGGQVQVLSQFDGLSLREITAAWKQDHTAVLVGTRSLMTGVDAPGETNSLVLLDRIPRSAGNPVDDARVESLVSAGVVDDKWAGDRLVYVADAALLLQQASGRLIRHATDRGMVAVLDPRLLKTSVVKYNEQTRRQLIDPLMDFGHKLTTIGEATDWLSARQAAARAA